MAGERWRRRGEALAVVNYLKLPLIRGARGLRGAVRLRAWEERDYRVLVVEAGLPRSRPLLVVAGVVLERSRPLSPARLLRRLRRLERTRQRRGPPQADVVYYLALGPGARLTRGAEKLARRLRVYAAPYREIPGLLAGFLLYRLRRFLDRVGGRRLYGGLEHLPLALLRLAEALGAEAPVELREGALRAAM